MRWQHQSQTKEQLEGQKSEHLYGKGPLHLEPYKRPNQIPVKINRSGGWYGWYGLGHIIYV
jgi:hypothetical protein